MIYQIPVAPTAKGRPRVMRKGTYTPDKTVDAEERIKWHLRQLGAIPSGKALSVKLWFQVKPPVKIKHKYPVTRPDLDQYVKLVLDAGNGLLWEDDSQIVKLEAHKVYAPEPMICITVWEAE